VWILSRAVLEPLGRRKAHRLIKLAAKLPLPAVSHGIGRAVDERVLDPEIVQMGKAF